MIIDQSNVTETEPHVFCCDASDLGYTAGKPLPAAFDTTLGNGQSLRYWETIKDREGDVMLWIYRQGNGIISLRVFND